MYVRPQLCNLRPLSSFLVSGIHWPKPGFRPTERIQETGRRLARVAHQLGVSFDFHAIAEKWEAITPVHLFLHSDEVLLAVDCIHRLHHLFDEYVNGNKPTKSVSEHDWKHEPKGTVSSIVLLCHDNGRVGYCHTHASNMSHWMIPSSMVQCHFYLSVCTSVLIWIPLCLNSVLCWIRSLLSWEGSHGWWNWIIGGAYETVNLCISCLASGFWFGLFSHFSFLSADICTWSGEWKLQCTLLYVPVSGGHGSLFNLFEAFDATLLN